MQSLSFFYYLPSVRPKYSLKHSIRNHYIIPCKLLVIVSILLLYVILLNRMFKFQPNRRYVTGEWRRLRN
jgi:uncharacterized membrane protein YiaA